MATRVALLAACILFIGLFARAPASTYTRDSRLVLPRPALLKALGRSHLQLVTDYFWLRTLNRSVIVLDETEGKALIALGELISDLDPPFRYPYWLVGLNAPISPQKRGEVWPNSREAARYMERGYALAPEDDKMAIVLATNYMLYQRDYVSAARVLRKRLEYPNAPVHFAPLATRLLAAAGDFDASREFARAMIESADDEDTKKMFEERLKLIDLEEILAAVDAASARFREKEGRHPISVTELIETGYLAERPQDPYGGIIVLTEGRSYSTAARERLEVHGRDSD